MIRTRLAPSPTGNPHIGTLFQALFDYVYAKKKNGKFIIRIEDTDKKREVKDSEQAIFNALDWLGLTPDESIKHGGSFGPYRQSERLNIYQKYAKQLIDQNYAYYCFCSQERLEQVNQEMQKNGQPPMYDKHCFSLSKKEIKDKLKTSPHVIRLNIPQNKTIIVNDLVRGEIKFDSNTINDQVLLKSDGYPTYHLAVVVDDHLMKITHMVRGEEWISSAPKHVLLYQYFNWNPPKFIHTPLLRNPDRSKLSKRHGHASFNWYLDQGYLKEAIINFLATRVWNHPLGQEIFGIDELIKHFEFENMHIKGPIADIDKLNWINAQWIRRLDEKDILKRLENFIPKELNPQKFSKIWTLINQRIEHLSQVKDLVSYFITQPELSLKKILKESKMDKNQTKNYLNKAENVIKDIKNWNIKTIEEALHQLQAKENLKPRPAFMTLRLAITGRAFTPPLFDVLEILGKETVIKRLQHAQKIF
ncbi:MAG: glutamate--tRNA ligase [Candidatus Beckwithbacteria bacterium]|nr:glutamate--tRNA ligase [Patescibacteria group bacterium]